MKKPPDYTQKYNIYYDLRLIPPGIHDARSRAVLGLFAHGAALMDFKKLLMRNSAEMPDGVLPLAIYERSLSAYFPPSGLPVNIARKLIDNAFEVKSKEGTEGGIQFACKLFGADISIQQWYEQNPPAHHDTYQLSVFFEDNLFPQIAGSWPNDATHQAAIRQAEKATKRWSQEVAFRFGNQATVKSYIGCRAATGARYTGGLPGPEQEVNPAIEFIAAAVVTGGRYQGGL